MNLLVGWHVVQFKSLLVKHYFVVNLSLTVFDCNAFVALVFMQVI